MRYRRLALITIATSLLMTPQREHCVLGVGDVAIVSDPQGYLMQIKDYAQQALAYKAALDQIQNQIRSLAFQAQNLRQLPVSLVNELTNSMRDYNAILQGAQGLSYRLSTARSQFEHLYGTGTAVGAQLTSLAGQWTGQVRAAAASAVQAQAVSDKLSTVQARLGTALSLSDAAQGDLDVQQAGNTLLGLLAEQHAALLELQATSGRLQAAVAAQQAAKEEAGRQMVQQWLGGPMPQYYAPGQQSGGIDLPTLR